MCLPGTEPISAKSTDGKGGDIEHCAFMVSLFHSDMEDGLFLTPKTDTYDVGDRQLQWGLKLTVKNELRNYFSSPIWLDDYDLRRYQPSEIGGVNPHIYGPWWRGPYKVT